MFAHSLSVQDSAQSWEMFLAPVPKVQQVKITTCYWWRQQKDFGQCEREQPPV